MRHKWTRHGTGSDTYSECPCGTIKGYVFMVLMYTNDGKATTKAPPCTRNIKQKQNANK